MTGRVMISRSITAAALAAGLLFNNTAAAQVSSDDWDYGENAGEKIVIAAVTFDTFGIAVRCQDNALSVVVSGLPVATGERKLRYQMGDNPEIESVWVSGRNSAAAFAVWPQRIASELSYGGTLRISALDGDQVRRYQVDLPASPISVPRVMSTCGHEPYAQADAPTGENLAGLRWTSRPEINFPSRSSVETGLSAIQCWVRPNGRLRDCDILSEFPQGAGFGRAATLGAHRTAQVASVSDTSENLENRRVNFVIRYNSYEAQFAPPPSRLTNRDDNYNRPADERVSE